MARSARPAPPCPSRRTRLACRPARSPCVTPFRRCPTRGYPHRARCNALAADAEVAGDEDDLATRVHARRGVVTDGRAADLAPILGEDVLAVTGARHPGLHRLVDREVRRRPDDVLADGPVAGVALCVVA